MSVGPHDHYGTNGLWIEVGVSQEGLDTLLEDRLFYTRFEYGLSHETRQEEDILYFTAMTWTDDGVNPDGPGVYWLTGIPEDCDLGGVVLGLICLTAGTLLRFESPIGRCRSCACSWREPRQGRCWPPSAFRGRAHWDSGPVFTVSFSRRPERWARYADSPKSSNGPPLRPHQHRCLR